MKPDTRLPEAPPAPPVSDGEPDDAASTLIVFGDDDEAICVDDTCVPVSAGR
jgi:hypothetical protein